MKDVYKFCGKYKFVKKAALKNLSTCFSICRNVNNVITEVNHKTQKQCMYNHFVKNF